MNDICDRLMENAFGPAQCPVCGVERGGTMGCGEPCSFVTDYGESRDTFADPWQAKRDIAALVHEVRRLQAENEQLREDYTSLLRTSNSFEFRMVDAEARLAEAVEVMRSCRATYVENDDAYALDRIINNIDDFLDKLEGR